MTAAGTRITLIRHAESEMNQTPGLVGGRSNHTPLTPAGLAAARQLGHTLQSGPRPAAVAHTSAIRSAQTARALVDAAGWTVPLVLEDGLIELSQGAAEGRPREHWWTAPTVAAMHTDPLRHRLAPGGETHLEVQERMRQALLRLASTYPGGRILAIGHGIAIRTLAWSLIGGGHETFRAMELGNLGRLDVTVTAGGRLHLAPNVLHAQPRPAATVS